MEKTRFLKPCFFEKSKIFGGAHQTFFAKTVEYSADFVNKLKCRMALGERPILTFIRQEIVSTFRSYSSMGSKVICTHVAHKKHTMQKIRFLCLLCAYHNVPDVRTYLRVRAILKFSIRAFQRRVPIQNPT